MNPIYRILVGLLICLGLSPALVAWASEDPPSLPAETIEIKPLSVDARLLEEFECEIVDPEGLLIRLDSRLSRLESYSARFRQINQYAAAAFCDTFSGRVHADLPDDFILHYDDPPGQFIRSDGVTLSMYVPENMQVVQGTIRRASDEMNFFRLLRGYLHVSDANASVSPGTNEQRLVVLRPRQDAAIQEMRLLVSTKDLLPTRVEIVDENSNLSAYELHEARVDLPLSRELFHPPIPEGVETIRQ